MRLATEPVCAEHDAPGEILRVWLDERPDITLTKGPRGGGKSHLRAFATHYNSLVYPKLGTRVLGGSLAQSEQIYNSLRTYDSLSHEMNAFDRFTKTQATYCNGSEVKILAASQTSVRGPHVQELCLDEVDEIDPDLRESSLGMCMALNGVSGSVCMTSTEHRIAGPMAELIKKGKEGAFPVFTFCAFEVLERCPPIRSGKNLEHCPECPLVQWCHSDMAMSCGIPKAKRANGHYAIDSLIQKVRFLSPRVFESDYLCLQPRAAGVWFTRYDDLKHVAVAAECDPYLPVHIAIDCGVMTGAVFFQVRRTGGRASINVFGDYLSSDRTAELDAVEIKGLYERLTGKEFDRRDVRVSVDSSGGAKNPVGITVITIYQNAGLIGKGGLEHWPKYPGSVNNSLDLVDSFVQSADGNVWLTIHPRCTHLKDAFKSYVRKKVDGQYLDEPEDPQHPHEDMIDALRGGIATEFPEALRHPPLMQRRDARSVF